MGGKLFIIMLLLLQPVLGAELTGTIYNEDLGLAKNVLVTVDSVPQQRMLSTDGHYMFSLPPGNYTLQADYAFGGENFTSVDYVSIREDGRFVFDLFLFPNLGELDLDEEVVLDEELFVNPEVPTQPSDVGLRLFWVLLVIGFFYAAWKVIQRRVEEPDELSAQVLTKVDRAGGRMTQKELRAAFPLSEAKISLVVTELEHAGKLKKIKKGRANILVRNK